MVRRRRCGRPHGAAVLRPCISEDCANHRGKRDWCGAATTGGRNKPPVRAFLFQFCTSDVCVEPARDGLFIRAKCLIQLSSLRVAAVLRLERQGCSALCERLLARCPRCAGIDSDVFNRLRRLPHGSSFMAVRSRKKNDSDGRSPTNGFAQREVLRASRRHRGQMAGGWYGYP